MIGGRELRVSQQKGGSEIRKGWGNRDRICYYYSNSLHASPLQCLQALRLQTAAAVETQTDQSQSPGCISRKISKARQRGGLCGGFARLERKSKKRRKKMGAKSSLC